MESVFHCLRSFSLFQLSVGLWLVRALVESLSLMHAGDFQCNLLLLLFFLAERNHVGIGAVEKNMLLILHIISITELQKRIKKKLCRQ